MKRWFDICLLFCFLLFYSLLLSNNDLSLTFSQNFSPLPNDASLEAFLLLFVILCFYRNCLFTQTAEYFCVGINKRWRYRYILMYKGFFFSGSSLAGHDNWNYEYNGLILPVRWSIKQWTTSVQRKWFAASNLQRDGRWKRGWHLAKKEQQTLAIGMMTWKICGENISRESSLFGYQLAVKWNVFTIDHLI